MHTDKIPQSDWNASAIDRQRRKVEELEERVRNLEDQVDWIQAKLRANNE